MKQQHGSEWLVSKLISNTVQYLCKLSYFRKKSQARNLSFTRYVWCLASKSSYVIGVIIFWKIQPNKKSCRAWACSVPNSIILSTNVKNKWSLKLKLPFYSNALKVGDHLIDDWCLLTPILWWWLDTSDAYHLRGHSHWASAFSFAMFSFRVCRYLMWIAP